MTGNVIVMTAYITYPVESATMCAMILLTKVLLFAVPQQFLEKGKELNIQLKLR
jgi:hypothetical protein